MSIRWASVGTLITPCTPRACESYDRDNPDCMCEKKQQYLNIKAEMRKTKQLNYEEGYRPHRQKRG